MTFGHMWNTWRMSGQVGNISLRFISITSGIFTARTAIICWRYCKQIIVRHIFDKMFWISRKSLHFRISKLLYPKYNQVLQTTLADENCKTKLCNPPESKVMLSRAIIIGHPTALFRRKLYVQTQNWVTRYQIDNYNH